MKRVVVECFSALTLLTSIGFILYYLKPDSADGFIINWMG